MQDAVRLKDITQIYVSKRQAVAALQDIQLSVKPGEFVSIVGPSGCGKTTLLSIIAGLIAPTVGKLEIYGEPVSGPSLKTGYMLQQDYLFPWRTIMQNAVIGLELLGRLDFRSELYVQNLLDDLGLGSYMDAYPSQLSGGMRQRVALARMLAADPQLLLLDEPFSALDHQTKLKLEDLVFQTLKKRKKTAILVTHDISEAIAMSDRVLVMESGPGRISWEVPIAEAIRKELPFQAREQVGFQHIFKTIWKRLESAQGKG